MKPNRVCPASIMAGKKETCLGDGCMGWVQVDWKDGGYASGGEWAPPVPIMGCGLVENRYE